MTVHSTREFAAPLANLAPLRAPASPRPVSPAARFEAGARIFSQGDRAGKIYRVKAGIVRLYRLLSDGRRQVTAFCLPGDVFGLAPEGSHHLFAEAVEETQLAVYPALEALDGDVMALLLGKLFTAQNHLTVLGRHQAAERLASFLLDMAARQGTGTRVDLPMSRTDIADYLGLTIETVSRSLAKLQQERLVRLNGARHIELLDAETLRGMVE